MFSRMAFKSNKRVEREKSFLARLWQPVSILSWSKEQVEGCFEDKRKIPGKSWWSLSCRYKITERILRIPATCSNSRRLTLTFENNGIWDYFAYFLRFCRARGGFGIFNPPSTPSTTSKLLRWSLFTIFFMPTTEKSVCFFWLGRATKNTLRGGDEKIKIYKNESRLKFSFFSFSSRI